MTIARQINEPTSPSPGSLEEQMARALSGDKVAYDFVLRAITQSLKAYLSRKLPPKDRDDVIQDILISVHRARPTYDSARPLMPWVMAIARYRLHDHWRRHYGHFSHEMIDIEEVKNILSHDATESLEIREDIRRALLTLPPRQQAILDLMYRQDKNVQEVATAMKMSVSAVKVAAHRTYKLLRKTMMKA